MTLPGEAARRRERAAARAVKARAATAARSARSSKAKSASYDTLGRQQVYLDALRAGHTKIDARRRASRENHRGQMVPLTEGTVRKWRERNSVFREACDAAYGQFRSEEVGVTKSYDGSFPSFRKAFFGYDTPKHQRLIVDVLTKALHSKQRTITLILVPPEGGKTSTLEDWLCKIVGEQPDVRSGIVSGTPRHGWKIIGKLKKRFTAAGSKFVMQYGPFYEAGQEKQGKPWAQDHITVLKRDSDERDYTISTFGWNGSMIGTRWDILIVDDIQPHKMLSQTEAIMSAFRQDIYTRVGIDCPIVIIGNRVGMGDFYEELIRLGIVDELIEVPAIDENGESFWPEKWPLEALERTRRVVGEDVWWRNYMQRPRASGKGSFSEALVEQAKDKMQTHLRPSECTGVIIGVDPALGGGNATIAAAYTENWLCVLDLDYSFNLYGTEDIFNRADEMAVRYGSGIVVIEQNAMQKGIVRDQRLDDLASRHNYRVVAHQTGQLKTDPTWGVGTMADSMRRGELRLAWGTDDLAGIYTQARLQPLVDQLTAWRPDVPTKNLRQDTVMALWFAHKWWKENRMYGVGSQSNFRTSHKLPYRPTSYHQRVPA